MYVVLKRGSIEPFDGFFDSSSLFVIESNGMNNSIKKLRQEKICTRSDLASYLSLSKDDVKELENKTGLDDEILEKLSRKWNVSKKQILETQRDSFFENRANWILLVFSLIAMAFSACCFLAFPYLRGFSSPWIYIICLFLFMILSLCFFFRYHRYRLKYLCVLDFIATLYPLTFFMIVSVHF